MHPVIDIVVPTYNRGDLILETIESLLASRRSDIAIWIVDQSADGRTRDAIQSLMGDHRLHYTHSLRKGSNFARNLGASLGNAPIVAYTDDDCIVAPEWIDETILAFEQTDIDAVFGRVIDQSIGLPGEAVTDGIKIAVKDEPQRKLFHGNRFKLDFGHGANMAFRRSVLESIAGFDPLLGNGGPLRSWPEKDIGYRILAQNGVILYEPNAVVHHKQWRSWSGVKHTQKNYGFGAGAIAARYLKNGDMGGLYLLVEWILDQGVRQVISGLFKWRSWQKITAGLIQIFYPIPGFLAGLKHPPRSESIPHLFSAKDHQNTTHPTPVNNFTRQLN